ncbi:MAG TPA: lipoprotein [Steroidobacteraceae bacterium]|nr:lipoprotein [Steroidobacteraceae bacterium]
MRGGRRLLLALAVLAAAGCGQKGPLYLPDKNATVVTTPAPAATPADTSQPAAPPAPRPHDKDQDSQQPPPK